jgi:hypothetical protein
MRFAICSVALAMALSGTVFAASSVTPGDYPSGPEFAQAIATGKVLLDQFGPPHSPGTKPKDGAQAAQFIGEYAGLILFNSRVPAK